MRRGGTPPPPIKIGRGACRGVVNKGVTFLRVSLLRSARPVPTARTTPKRARNSRKHSCAREEVSRITSKFHARALPSILDCGAAHKGHRLFFCFLNGAPTGTRSRHRDPAIVEEKSGRQGGYGNFLVVEAPGHLTAPHMATCRASRRGDPPRHACPAGFRWLRSRATAGRPHPHCTTSSRERVQHDPLSIVLPTALADTSEKLDGFRGRTRHFRVRLALARGGHCSPRRSSIRCARGRPANSLQTDRGIP